MARPLELTRRLTTAASMMKKAPNLCSGGISEDKADNGVWRDRELAGDAS